MIIIIVSQSKSQSKHLHWDSLSVSLFPSYFPMGFSDWHWGDGGETCSETHTTAAQSSLLSVIKQKGLQREWIRETLPKAFCPTKVFWKPSLHLKNTEDLSFACFYPIHLVTFPSQGTKFVLFFCCYEPKCVL